MVNHKSNEHLMSSASNGGSVLGIMGVDSGFWPFGPFSGFWPFGPFSGFGHSGHFWVLRFWAFCPFQGIQSIFQVWAVWAVWVIFGTLGYFRNLLFINTL